MASLLDGIFSKYHTKRGNVTGELLCALELELETARLEWHRMGLSNTPKWHMILDHAIQQLRRIGGFRDMLEDAIERSHQQRVADEARLVRLRNEKEVKRSQCKFQNARMIQGVVDVRTQIMTNRKRKMTATDTLQERRETAKR